MQVDAGRDALSGVVLQERRLVVFVFILACIHGLIFVFLLPPWQHYDEPNHFERLWLTVNLGHRPKPGDQNAEFSRQVVESMLAHGFYEHLSEKPSLSTGQEVEIPGYSQLDEPPLYYLLASIPLRIMHSAGVESQLYVARLFSLLLYLVTILAAWDVSRQLTRPGHALRWLLPATLALLPGFVDVMTAVNNDAAAVAVFSLFLSGSVRFIRRGFSIFGFIWVVGSAVLTYWVKNTAVVAIPLLPVVLCFGLLRGKWRPWAWGILLAGLFAGMALAISWRDAAYWYRNTAQVEAIRSASSQAVVGRYVFHLSNQNGEALIWPAPVFQLLPASATQALRGETVTVGAWIWGDRDTSVSMPSLHTPASSTYQVVQVSQAPQFYVYTTTVPPDASRIWIDLAPGAQNVLSATQIYYDGLVLVKGRFSDQSQPQVMTADGRLLDWNGQKLVNFLRNSSAEFPGLGIRYPVDQLGLSILPDNLRPSMILSALVDWQGSGYLFSLTAQRLFMTFWAWLGWGHILLAVAQFYTVLGFLIFLAFAGVLAIFIHKRRTLPWEVIFFFALALLLSWGITFTRGVAYLNSGGIYLAVARHSYPVIIPTMFVLCTGWFECANLLGDLLVKLSAHYGLARLSQRTGWVNLLYLGLLAVFLMLDMLAISSVILFYNQG